MNHAVKSQWGSALRSGEYRQVSGTFQCRDGFCVLGVLRDLFIKSGEPVRDVEVMAAALEWAGIQWDMFSSTGLVNDLIRHNDSGVPFHALAEMIESQY